MANAADGLDETLDCLLKAVCPANSAVGHVPDSPGYYSIFIDQASSLPDHFNTKIANSGSLLLYIGNSTSSVHERLLMQDLYGKSNSTFFRGIGAILGYRPPYASLANKVNQNNYKFSEENCRKIREWNEQHLSISWFETRPSTRTEMLLIKRSLPLINSVHNPTRDPNLADLREECTKIARGAE
jgi:GIY-YIG catalytic domain-containing protein